MTKSGYIELHAHSAYSFLCGTAHPADLVAEAVHLGLDGIALTDYDGFYGAAQMQQAAAGTGLCTIYGAELTLGESLQQQADTATGGKRHTHLRQPELRPPAVIEQGSGQQHLLVLARGLAGYQRLSHAIATAQLAGGEKGRPRYDLAGLARQAAGHWMLLVGGRHCRVGYALKTGGVTAALQASTHLMDLFGRENIAVELTHHQLPDDDERIAALAQTAAQLQLPIVATSAAHYAAPATARAASAFTALRARQSLTQAHPLLPAGPGAHLRSASEMRQLLRHYPEAITQTVAIGEECAFNLQLIAPQLPPYPVPPGHNEASYLRELTLRGAEVRYGPPEANPMAYEQLERELRIITALDFPGYFLVVYDLVQFCRSRNIFCQGRGSAANSAVCFALGVTNVDAVRYQLLFERFLSPTRQGPPDIDIDIESDRREEVIQYVYQKYGRHYAAQVANVATYRPKMAVRDAAKALGYSPGQQDAYSKALRRRTSLRQQLDDTDGIDAGDADHIPADVAQLAQHFENLPRHLALHSGGMVICDRPVTQVVPVEWARKAGRSVLQWDKDDCAAMGLVKFDLLGLGMLSALHYTVDLVQEYEKTTIDFAALDLTDPAVYAMISKADTVGVFQVESRAQMATLPRLQPEHFYDLVVAIALIRPGPIQGGSVHPYIQRRAAVRRGTWRGPFVAHPAMARSLDKTLGVPLFQEQLMELAIDIAGFDAGEADLLRKALASKHASEKMAGFRKRIYRGMQHTHGISGDLADEIYGYMLAFAGFGFAESHALSFASLVYYSAYLKLYHPAAFLAGLLRAQPMGFYPPRTLVADARRHGVAVYRADINYSAAHTTLTPGPQGKPAVRLGLAGIRGIGEKLAHAIVAARPDAGYRHTHCFVTHLATAPRSAAISATQLETLATAGALNSLVKGEDCGEIGCDDADLGEADTASVTAEKGEKADGSRRRRALWEAGAATQWRPDMLPLPQPNTPHLPGMSPAELVIADLWASGISPDHHPVEFSRSDLAAQGVVTAADLATASTGTRVVIAGLVTHRQRPPTAGGVTFLNIEDETGLVNVIVTAGLWKRHRVVARNATALIIRGVLQRSGEALSLLADRLAAMKPIAAVTSRDFQ